MKLGFKKKQRESGTGGQPLELGEGSNEAAEKAANLDDVLGDIDQILNETAREEVYCCRIERRW